jgi:hypothetical protein
MRPPTGYAVSRPTMLRRTLPIGLLALACAAACGRKPAVGDDPAADDAAAPYQAAGRRPVNPARGEPPPAIADALAVGAPAPGVELPMVAGGTRGTFHLADALAKERALLVFYRGDR